MIVRVLKTACLSVSRMSEKRGKNQVWISPRIPRQGGFVSVKNGEKEREEKQAKGREND